LSLGGDYVGTLRSMSGEGAVNATLDAAGGLPASKADGCHVIGSLSARPQGNLHDARLGVRACAEVIAPLA
jgi:hypothetical protein